MNAPPIHEYDPVSGWCLCGHHRDDGRHDRDKDNRPTVAEIRQILGPTYQPKEQRA